MKIRVKTECEKQFLKNNKFNYSMTLLSLVISACMDVALAIMLYFFFVAATTGDNQTLFIGTIAGGVFCALYVLCKIIKRSFMNKYLKTALSQFKGYVFSKILSKSISEYRRESSAKFISAFSNDLNSIELNYLVGSIDIMGSVFTFVASGIAMLFFDWRIGLAMIVAAMVCSFLSMKYGRRLVKKESKTANENMGFIDQVKDLLNGFIVIKSFRAEKEVLQIFNERNVELESTKQSRRATSETVTIFGDLAGLLLNSILFSAVFALGIGFGDDAGTGAALLMVFIQLLNYMLVPVRKIGSGISNRRAAQALIDRISEAIEEDPTYVETEKEELTGVDGGIEFKNVNFGYEDDTKNILKNINIKFEKGKSYAIVGSSGSGKSTLLKLILGHMPNYDGSITIDGKEIKNLSLDSLYEHVSVIQQDVFLFDSTIQNNITMFRDFDADKLKSAIERAGLSSLIAEKGDDYPCGECGKHLSGGEKQRVSIARCLVRETPVLLMDEATAALDSETAFSVTNEILGIDGLTRIIVTHGLEESLLLRYDEIIVIQGGRIVEQGHFNDLMEQKGYFYSLYNVFQS
ncbi:MAG: ABC transporter ATP-binding protein [Clostridia bacterium]|nr:ABC transporter ATP-binding protein [Clostridia bacterium]